jgi:peptide/nickel transport system permease protein
VIRFLIRRLAQSVLVLFIVSVILYWLFFTGGGANQVALRFAGKAASAARVAQIKHDLHLDQPVYLQYWHWVWAALHGNLGYDYYQDMPVVSVIKQAAPATISLVLGAAVIWILYGVLTGILSAVKNRSWLDRFFTSSALFFYSMPTFVLGVSLIWLLAYKTRPFPFEGYVAITANPYQWFLHLVLPWLTLALVTAATYTRLTRSSMLDVMGEDYIRTARSKGMRERRVIFRHELRASLTPITTQAGLDIGTALGGVIIVETVFGITGLGWTAVKAITNQDLPIIMGITMLAAAFIVVANLVVDILYSVLDPRVRL